MMTSEAEGLAVSSPRDELRSELRRFIEENFLFASGASARLRDSDSFLEHHVLDSTGFLELVAHLEQAYGIRVADDEMVPENLDGLDALAAYVARKRGGAAR